MRAQHLTTAQRHKLSNFSEQLRLGLTRAGMRGICLVRLALKGAGLTPPASGESHTWGFLFSGAS